MIWVFTCSTEDCFYQINPARIVNPINPVMCGACFEFTNAIETDEVAPELNNIEIN
jgi:hypothetical protein